MCAAPDCQHYVTMFSIHFESDSIRVLERGKKNDYAGVNASRLTP